MSNTWSEGYFTDVGYTFGYYREISPVFQRFCLLIRGIATPECDDASHCELGFGQGVSVNIHAAANPGHYIGTDFNPEHAAHARSLAAAAGSGARLYDDSFEELLNRNDLPQFDSISLHGIWTWVSRDNHKIITEFARRHLKPGGLLYLSYNCFPGWAPAYPLRQLFALHDRYASASHGVGNRVEAALKFTEGLLGSSPAYGKAVPGLNDRLTKIMEQNRNYLAHEYFNREWNCMYFTDVVDALTPAKLAYAASATPLDLVDAVNITPEAGAFLNGIEHPILREQARDYFVNQQFRKDLYLRGVTRLKPVEQRERLLSTRFVLVLPADKIPLKVQGVAGEAELQAPLYRPVIDFLAAREYVPKTLRETLKALPDMNYAQVVQIFIVLSSMNAVAPCQSEAAVKQVRKNCDALNRHLCERAQFGEEFTFLASPLTGAGMAVDRISQLFLLARQRKHNNPAAFVWEVFCAAGQVLLKDGKPVEGAEANLAELLQRYTTFTEQTLTILKVMGIA